MDAPHSVLCQKLQHPLGGGGLEAWVPDYKAPALTRGLEAWVVTIKHPQKRTESG